MGTETLVAVIVSNTVFSLWEFFLGKTKKIDANSTAELTGNIAVKLFKKIFKR